MRRFAVLPVVVFLTLGCGARDEDAPEGFDAAVTAHADVDQPVDVVWQRLRDLRVAEHYVPDVTGVEITTDLERGLGASRRVRLGRGGFLDETVVDWREGEGSTLRLHLAGERPPTPFERAHFRYALEPSAGGTRVVTELAYSLRWGALCRWLDRVVVRRISQENVDAVAEGFVRFCRPPKS